jgi:ABC-type transport system involved in multi-copper enzyme maturation permease subunit
MIRSLKRIWAVALLTSIEGLRQPAFFLLFAAAAALTGFTPSFAFFHLGEEAKMVTDLGLSTILAFSTLLALLTASSTVTDEIEGRTALTMLSKPLRREEFLIGKYLGVAVTACALILLMGPVLLATLRSQKYETFQDPMFTIAVVSAIAIGVTLFAVALIVRLIFHKGIPLVGASWISFGVATAFMMLFLAIKSQPNVVWEWRILFGLLFIGLHACVISAVAVTLATRLTLVQSAIGTGAFFVVGHASGALVAPFRDENHNLTVVGSIFRTILPDLDQFNITDALATAFLDKPIDIPWDVVASSTLYALLYGIALMAVAAALFARRELG